MSENFPEATSEGLFLNGYDNGGLFPNMGIKEFEAGVKELDKYSNAAVELEGGENKEGVDTTAVLGEEVGGDEYVLLTDDEIKALKGGGLTK